MPATWKQIAYKADVLPDLLSPYVVGDLIYASSASGLSKLADIAVGSILVSGGIGAAPVWSASPSLTTSLTVPCILAPAATLVIRPTTDAVTAIQLQDKDGNNILNVDTTNNRVGVGTAAPAVILDIAGAARATLTTVNTNGDAYMVTLWAYANTNGAYYNKGTMTGVYPRISAEVTNSGYCVAHHVYASGYSAGMAGTLADLTGFWVQYGMESTAANTAVITKAYGIKIKPLSPGTGASYGSVTTSYAIYIDGSTAGDNITNRWAIYQAEGAARNYFAGNLGIGTIVFGTSLLMGIAQGAGTAPSSAPANMGQLWVEDINGAAGFSGFHKMTETTAQKEVIPGVIIKTDTGSPANPYEGLMEINTYDNKIRMYGDAGWRELGTW